LALLLDQTSEIDLLSKVYLVAFFRDTDAFFKNTILPKIINKTAGEIRIWIAALLQVKKYILAMLL
jgi:chemotaxis methyl-accepting protein methylase